MCFSKAAIVFIAIMTVIVQPLWASREPIIPSGLIGPRVLAMGGSGVAMPGSASTSTINPASLVFINWPEIAAGYGQQDMGNQQVWFVNGTMPLISQLVTQINVLSLKNPNQPNEQYNSYNMGLAFSVSPNGKLLAGINGKLLQATVPDVYGVPSGGGVDIGMFLTVWEGRQNEALRCAVSMIDAQSIIKLDGQAYILPSVFRYGLSWQITKALITNVEFDSQNSQMEGLDSFSIIRLGLEHTLDIEPLKGLALRAGYFKRFDDEGSITLGIGTGYDDWRLDYAIQMPTSFYNAYHHFSISWGLGRTVPHQVAVSDETDERLTKENKKEEVKEEHLAIFSALESAVDVDEDFEEFIPQARSDFQEDEAANLEETEEKEAGTSYAYNMAVPAGPAAQEKVSLGVDLEMPTSLSGYLNSGSGQYKIVKEDVRLHAVINPFSPNNDGKQDKTILVGRLVNERLRVNKWRLYIIQAGNVIRSFKGGIRLPRNLEWDGKNDQGKKLRDGEYTAVFKVLDENEMELATATEMIEIRTKSKPVEISGPSSITISGKTKDKSLTFIIPRVFGSSNWQFIIYSSSNKRVYEKSGSGQIPEKMSWKPQINGKPPSAGNYRVVLRYRDEVGLKTKAETYFKINYAQFNTTIVASPSLFKPVKQGGTGVSFKLGVKGQVKLKSWKLQIIDEKNSQEVKSFSGKGIPPKSIVWDGTDKEEKVVNGGSTYIGRLLIMTVLGTKASVVSEKIQCDVGAYTGKKALTMNLVRVLFEKGKSILTAKAKQSLETAAKTVTQYKMEYQLQITGHADEKEGENKSLELSRKRAQQVADYLEKTGKIPASKLQVIGKGTDKMMIQAGNDSERAKNRRVEVMLFAK